MTEEERNNVLAQCTQARINSQNLLTAFQLGIHEEIIKTGDESPTAQKGSSPKEKNPGNQYEA